jgi:hypothetical protein
MVMASTTLPDRSDTSASIGEHPRTIEERSLDELNERRAELIDGLRALAQFYFDHPEMPIPLYPDFSHCVMAGDDDAGIDEVRQIAAILGSEVDNDGNPSTRRTFAGLRYSAFYVRREVARRHAAFATYSGLVEPEGGES